jgi:uncharacterized protein YndB with AHSA1/START domain
MPSERNDAERSLTITRDIRAPRELVWEALTDPEHLVHWWGPDGFTNTFYEIDVKPGGVWHFMMHGPDGKDYPNKIVFREITEPERIAWDHSGDGDAVETDHRFSASITLAEKDGVTTVTLRSVFDTQADYDLATEYAIVGGEQTLGRLEAHLTGMRS